MTFRQTIAAWWDPNHLPRPPSIADVVGRAAHPNRRSGGSAPLYEGDLPVVSVVMPIYNGEAYLEHAIQSVLEQDYPAVEIVAVDGASSDGTPSILERHDARLRLWVSEPDESMYDAINKGIAMARGDVIKILNADDELTEGSIARAMDALGDDDWAFIRGNIDVINQDGNVVNAWTAAHHASFLPDAFPLLHPSWYLPRAVYERLGLYQPRYRIAADTEYFYRLLSADVPLRHLDAPLVRFREGGMSASYGGVSESLSIHAQYLGRRRGAYVTARRAFQKARSNFLHAALGDDGYARLKELLRPGQP